MSPCPRWKPILTGDLRKQAFAAVHDIATALRRGRRPDPSLSRGQAGLSIFYAYLSKAKPGCGHEGSALRFLNRAVHAVATRKMPATLFAGFPGVAWAVAHLSELRIGGGEHFNQLIYRHLETHLRQRPWRGAYDLMTGLVGMGVYALERVPAPQAYNCIKLVVDHLTETAERTTKGLTWFTRPELLSDYHRRLCPGGYYSLGLSHGVPGPIALLGDICGSTYASLKSARDKARPLLTGAVEWLLAQEPENGIRPFSYWVAPDLRPPAQLAWCYGDLGIASALFRAARYVTEPSWERDALRIARRAAERSLANSGIRDCQFCHGAAGVGHIFNRLFQATGEPWLQRAARFWFKQTLRMRKRGPGIAGFAALRYRGRERWLASPGILEGAAGIGLALLAASTDIMPQWDRMFLLSGKQSDGLC